MVAGTAYSIETCYDHEQLLQHQPDHATAWTNLCVVPGTAYSNEASYEQALQHQPAIASAWNNLGLEGDGVIADTAYSEEACLSRHRSTSPPSRVLGTTLVSKAAARSLTPPTAKKHAMSGAWSYQAASRLSKRTASCRNESRAACFPLL